MAQKQSVALFITVTKFADLNAWHWNQPGP